MAALVMFSCPECGPRLAAPGTVRVECRCGQECAPAGVTVSQHRRRWSDRRRQQTARNRDIGAAKPQVRASQDLRKGRSRVGVTRGGRDRICDGCGALFAGRGTARFCGGACRQAAFRARRAS
jgi:hypothetical protein